MKTRINGLELAYTDQGHGPAVILIHGFPLDRSMWQPQVNSLTSAGFRVIAPDLRGFGESAAPSGDYSMDAFADDTAALMAQLGIGRAVVGGMSMGGYVLFNLLTRYPHKVAGAAFLLTRSSADDEAGKARRAEMAQAVRRGRRQEVEKVFADLLFAPETPEKNPALVERVKEMMARASDAGLAGALLAMSERPDFSGRLPQFDLPALVIGAREDRAVPADTIAPFAAALPKGSSCLIAGAGHLANLEREQAFNDCLLKFLRKIVQQP